MPGKWSVTVESGHGGSERVARVLFVPEGTDVGPTFAVRQPAFETVPVPAGGDVALCGGKVRLRVRPDGRPPHRDNLELHWTSGGVDRSWRPGDLDHENLGAPFLALDNLWRDYIPRWVRPADPMVGFDRHIWNTAAFTLAVEAAMTEAAGKAPTTEQRNAEVRRVLEGSAPGPEATGLNEWPEAVRTAREVVRHSPPGLLSRSGLTIFRDDTAPWNPQTGWIGPRPDPQPFVFYLIYHDCDWKLAARESASLLGPIPYVPAYLLGVWYSNYSALGQNDFQRLVADFKRHDLPLDLISVDMDWHGKQWYGFCWNEELFPDPSGFAEWLADQNLRAAFNVHPLYVPADDPRVDQFVQQSGHSGRVLGERGDWHPYQAGCLEVDIGDHRQAQAYLDLLHRPVEDRGCDFWWIDGSVKQPDGRDECSWLNHVYRNHLARRDGHPPIVLARAGGLGSHRDAVLFTGDACSQWEVLAFEVETVIRAAGALSAYVSHDIGGFYHDPDDRDENKPPDDLYLRWVQFGCLSPIMRLHSFDGVREPWRFEASTLEAVRRFMKLRIRLLPYLCGLVAEAHQTGVVPARPMWFEFDHPDAYDCLGQYMLGEALLVAPIVREDSTARYWLPAGRWHDAFSSRSETGPSWIEERVAHTVTPLWLRDGAVLDLAEAADRSDRAWSGRRENVSGAGWA